MKKKQIRHPLKGVWTNMKRRCNNPNDIGYKSYGGRGIKVEWKSFEEFRNDMYPTYKKGLTIERIDVNGNYSKENCTWITKQEQAFNRQNSVFLENKGVRKHIREWAKDAVVSPRTFYRRIQRYGFSVEDALTAPLNTHRRKNTGETMYISWREERKTWAVQIKGKYIGSYKTLKEATRVRDSALSSLEEKINKKIV